MGLLAEINMIISRASHDQAPLRRSFRVFNWSSLPVSLLFLKTAVPICAILFHLTYRHFIAISSGCVGIREVSLFLSSPKGLGEGTRVSSPKLCSASCFADILFSLGILSYSTSTSCPLMLMKLG